MNKYMDIALQEAKKAYKKREVPVGAIIVYNNKVIAKAHNLRQKQHNVLGHAEIIAIKKASKKLKDWRLNDCNMYVTLKPCNMCQEIINASRLNEVYYLVDKPLNKQEYYRTIYKRTNVRNDYAKLLSDFFKNKR